MTNQEIQWLLSLSVMSLLGPQFDLETLADKGFYKKKSKTDLFFELNITNACKAFKEYEGLIQSFVDSYHIDCKDDYIKRVEELIDGSAFSKNMTKLLQVGRTMSKENRDLRKPFVIDGRLYFYDIFEVVMDYDLDWPQYGLIAYDIANGLMLLRLGMYLDYINEEEQMMYLERIFYKAKEIFDSYLNFGKVADIGRKVDIRSTEAIINGQVDFPKEMVLEASYLGIWKHLEELQK